MSVCFSRFNHASQLQKQSIFIEGCLNISLLMYGYNAISVIKIDAAVK